MDGAAVKLKGASRLGGKLGNLIRAVTVGRLLYRAINGPAQLIVDNAQMRCPVDTGNLRDSIKAVPIDSVKRRGGAIGRNVGSDGVRVVVLARYAIHVEYGTREMAADPFLRPAVDEEHARFVRDVAVFTLETILEIWTAPLGFIPAFILSFPIEDAGDLAVEQFMNSRAKARNGGKAPEERVKAVRNSLLGRLNRATLRTAARIAKAEASAVKRLARAQKRGGNG